MEIRHTIGGACNGTDTADDIGFSQMPGIVYANGGNDYIDGASSDSTYYGGAGIDYFYIHQCSDVVIHDLFDDNHVHLQDVLNADVIMGSGKDTVANAVGSKVTIHANEGDNEVSTDIGSDIFITAGEAMSFS